MRFESGKRTNEDSAVEGGPAAQRPAISEQQDALKLQEAQEALARLNYKSAEQVCTQVSQNKRYERKRDELDLDRSF